ncbi:MAG TPA: hypothetical protein VIU11_05700 [Nakamurella sp.]
MALHEADRVVATHDIHGMFKGDIRQGTAGVVISHCGSDMPTYRVRFTIRPGQTAVVSDLTEWDIARS